MSHIEAMKQMLHEMEYVLDCINNNVVPFDGDDFHEALRLGRQAISEAEKQEPVACPYCKNWATLGAVYYDQNCAGCVKRMTHPQPKREWVELTPEEVLAQANEELVPKFFAKGAAWANAKLKEKNT